MKTNKILCLAMLAFLFFSSCKKDDVQPPTTITVNADGSLNINDADGALYAIETRNYETYNGPGYETSQFAFGWFGKFPAIVDGGVVKVNDNEVTNIFNYYNAIGFLSFGDTLFKGVNATASWNVSGNATAGVGAFTHTDNAPLPAAPTFTLPAFVNINNSLTINHAATSGKLGVIYSLRGDNGDTTKFVANSSNSVTFTSSEIKSVAVSGGGAIGLSIMGVSYTDATYAGKKYYFVKQHQFTRETVTQ